MSGDGSLTVYIHVYVATASVAIMGDVVHYLMGNANGLMGTTPLAAMTTMAMTRLS